MNILENDEIIQEILLSNVTHFNLWMVEYHTEEEESNAELLIEKYYIYQSSGEI